MTLQDFHEKGKAVKGEVGKRMVGYLSAALGLVAGLAWNDAVKSAIDYFIPNSNNTIIVKFVYAAGITLVIVLILLGLEKWVGRKEGE